MEEVHEEEADPEEGREEIEGVEMPRRDTIMREDSMITESEKWNLVLIKEI